jgi:hypothetical protein
MIVRALVWLAGAALLATCTYRALIVTNTCPLKDGACVMTRR